MVKMSCINGEPKNIQADDTLYSASSNIEAKLRKDKKKTGIQEGLVEVVMLQMMASKAPIVPPSFQQDPVDIVAASLDPLPECTTPGDKKGVTVNVGSAAAHMSLDNASLTGNGQSQDVRAVQGLATQHGRWTDNVLSVSAGHVGNLTSSVASPDVANFVPGRAAQELATLPGRGTDNVLSASAGRVGKLTLSATSSVNVTASSVPGHTTPGDNKVVTATVGLETADLPEVEEQSSTIGSSGLKLRKNIQFEARHDFPFITTPSQKVSDDMVQITARSKNPGTLPQNSSGNLVHDTHQGTGKLIYHFQQWGEPHSVAINENAEGTITLKPSDELVEKRLIYAFRDNNDAEGKWQLEQDTQRKNQNQQENEADEENKS